MVARALGNQSGRLFGDIVFLSQQPHSTGQAGVCKTKYMTYIVVERAVCERDFCQLEDKLRVVCCGSTCTVQAETVG